MILGTIIFIISIVTVFVTGISQFFIGSAVGLIAFIVALVTMVKRKSAISAYPVKVWVEGIGEIYRARLSESRGELKSERRVEEEQVISEISVRIAAESEPRVKLEELQSDIDQLVFKLESLSE